MSMAVISVFDDAKVVGKVMDELRDAGIRKQAITLLKGQSDEIVTQVRKLGFGESEARSFAEQSGRGRQIVTARGSEDEVNRASAIMERYEASSDTDSNDERSHDQRSANDDRGQQRPQGRSHDGSATVLQEELEVGKRKVASGGARLTTRISDTPVEETVMLRQERVEVDRRPVDREATSEELDRAFEDKTVEVMATSEEAEVGKRAHVVEEVTLGKTSEKKETVVRDTVRRRDVDIEKIEGTRKGH